MTLPAASRSPAQTFAHREMLGADPNANPWRLVRDPAPLEQDRPLPSPTRDSATLKADLDAHGYCLVANALTASEIEALQCRSAEQYRNEARLDPNRKGAYGDERVYNLLNKGKIFQSVLEVPLVVDLVEHLLGESFLLSSLSSITTKPGSLAQALHIDQVYLGFPTPVPVVCNAVWMLNDFTDENGGTRIIPGSHRWSPDRVATHHEGLALSGEDGSENPPGTIAAEAPAGTCMIFEGRLLHGMGRNRTKDRTRSGIFAYYCRPFMRQFENPFLSIPDKTMMSLSVEVRSQLGYRPWVFMGGVQRPGLAPPLDRVRPDDIIGELHD